MNKCLALIMGRLNSSRLYAKNIAPIGSQTVIEHTIAIAKASKVCDKVAVSTDSSRVEPYTISAGAEVIMRDSDWDATLWSEIIGKSITRYKEQSGETFTECVVMYGTAIFWRPSWIREAIRLIRHQTLNNRPITYVSPSWRNPEPCMAFRLFDYPQCQTNIFLMEHRGINIDIDEQVDFDLARAVMDQIESGRIPYPLEESLHEEPNFRQSTLSRAKNTPL